MSEPESADNRIEPIIRKWEMLYVSFTKIDARVQSPRQFYHLRRQVDSDRARATICGFGCKSTRTGRDVQQMCTGCRPRRRGGGRWPGRSPLQKMRDNSLPEHRDLGVRRRAVAPPRCWT